MTTGTVRPWLLSRQTGIERFFGLLFPSRKHLIPDTILIVVQNPATRKAGKPGASVVEYISLADGSAVRFDYHEGQKNERSSCWPLAKPGILWSVWACCAAAGP